MYVCVDNNAEHTVSSSSHDGNLFYAVEAVCGSLPCPPYRWSRTDMRSLHKVTCVKVTTDFRTCKVSK